MNTKTSLLVYAAIALLATSTSARTLTQSTYTDADIYNFALNLEYLEANFYHCAAYGTPISNNNGGPDPTGCVIGNYDSATLALAVELAGDEASHVLAIQAALGSAAIAQPAINLTAFSAAANAAFGTTLSPVFSYATANLTFLDAAFLLEDVGVTAYNGAAPLITDTTLLGNAVGIGLVEAYHAGIIRKTLYDNRATLDQYGIPVGTVIDTISAARGMLSASADSSMNSADEGITSDTTGTETETIVPSGAYHIAFSRTPAEVLAIVYLGSPSTPGGFFPNGVNGNIQG
ncbi:hypothetical protein WJX79_010734 [Trebouxia sp. C0005]|nr:MAG: hypothetical protein FRX49_07647 [Trebouxia sp. A1-2]